MNSEFTTIRFQLQESDLARVRLILSGNRRAVTLPKLILSWMIMMPLLPFGMFIIAGRFLETEVLVGYVILFLIGAYLAIVSWWSIRRQGVVWAKSATARRFLQPTTLTITPVGVKLDTALTQSSMAWPLITEISTTPDRQFVLLSLDRQQTIMIPARAFEDAHALDSFIEEAGQLHRQYVGSRMLCPKCQYDLRGDPDAGCPECGWQREQR